MSGVTNALTMSVPTPSPRFDPDNNDWYASAKHNATFANFETGEIEQQMKQRRDRYARYAYEENGQNGKKRIIKPKGKTEEKKRKGVIKKKTKPDTVSSPQELANAMQLTLVL